MRVSMYIFGLATRASCIETGGTGRCGLLKEERTPARDSHALTGQPTFMCTCIIEMIITWAITCTGSQDHVL